MVVLEELYFAFLSFPPHPRPLRVGRGRSTLRPRSLETRPLKALRGKALVCGDDPVYSPQARTKAWGPQGTAPPGSAQRPP